MTTAQLILDTVSRVVHVGTAITLVGGSVFMAFALLPASAELSDEEHDKLRVGVLGRWKKFVGPGIGLFILSGFYNFARLAPLHKGDSLYHALVGTKILLAFAVFFIASALVGKSKAFDKLRQNRAKWLKILILLAAIIVGISGFVKVRGIPVTTAVATPAAELAE
ncbi:MAG: hypothetical protein HQ518_06020 [Rhodopirellula sp.]|nr:hypothetical protein [Rhodopirellula sp.]